MVRHLQTLLLVLAALLLGALITLQVLKRPLWPPVVPTPVPTPPPTRPPEVPPLEEVEAPGLHDDRDAESLRQALTRSLVYLRRRPAGTRLRFGEEEVPIERVIDTLTHVGHALNRLGLSRQFFDWLKSRHRFLESTADEVRFTGYYLASLEGSRVRTERYRYPLYRRPDDLLRVELSQFDFFADFPGLPGHVNARATERGRVVPYYTRAEIDFGKRLDGRDLEMLWVDSLVELQSLHVQGSGVVELDDGDLVRVGFADSNGRKFRGVGEYLLSEGMVPRGQASYQGIKDFLKANPDLIERVLSQNARYIFFRELSGGPQGCLGVEITPHRTVATDHSVFPPGALGLIETDKPVFDEEGRLVRWERFRRLVLNQDTGAAIRGTGRVDLYCGFGEENARIAGSMHQPGRLFFLLER